MGQHVLALIAVTAASLLAAHGIARAQTNPWRVEPRTDWSGGAADSGVGSSSGQRAFEQGYQRGFEQGLRAAQGVQANDAKGGIAPSTDLGGKPGGQPAGGKHGLGSSTSALGHGAGFPGSFPTGAVPARSPDAPRWGDFPPLEGALPPSGRHSSGDRTERPLPRRDGYPVPDGARAAQPPYGPGYPPAYGYGYGGLPPYMAGPSTFANPYGGITGFPLAPGALGYPGGW